VAKVGTSKAGGTISQQAAVHPWLAADAHGNKQTNKQNYQGLAKILVENYSASNLITPHTPDSVFWNPH
jgi:hypothetical protein